MENVLGETPRKRGKWLGDGMSDELSDELIKRVSGALLTELRESGAFVGDKSTVTGLPLVNGFLDLADLAVAAINEVLTYQTADIIEQMKAGRPMPDEPGHPEVRRTAHGTMLVFSQPPEMEFDGDRD
jgi:hypothetical protein